MKRKLYGLFMIFPVMTLASCGNQPAPHVHSFGEWQQSDRDHYRTCTGCGEIENERHDFKSVRVEERTCTDVEHEHFRCTVCGYEKIVDGTEIDGHSYTSEITRRATCTVPGEITFTCSKCGDHYTTTFTDPDAHKFVEDSRNGSILTYVCEHNHEHTKTVIDASEQKVADVHADDLKETGEIQLEDAAIAFDEHAMEELNGDLKISAEPVNKETIAESIPEEIADKIGDNKIIDFSLKQGEENVSTFGGKVTVTIPYELKPGESPEGITILYLNGEESEAMEAKYNNGNVSFETTHFSYYSVAHYNPEELCEQFGHMMIDGNSVKSTCKAHGYVEHVCRRCSYSEQEIFPLENHEYVFKEKLEATVSQEGYVLYECKNCQEQYKTVIERKSGNQKGFFETLAYSMGSKPLHMHGVESMNGTSVPMDMYISKDYEDMIYMYMNIPLSELGGEEQEIIMYKGYSINSSSLGATYNPATGIATAALSQYQDILEKIPNGLLSQIEPVGEWIIEHLFDDNQDKDSGEHVMSLNTEKLMGLINTVMSGTLNEIITTLFGETAVSDLKSVIPFIYDQTVTALIEWLENKGIVLSEIYNAAIDIINMFGIMDTNELPSLEEILNMPMGATTPTEEGEQPQQIALKDMQLLQLLMMVPGAASMVPETSEELETMVDQFLGLTINDLMGMFSGSMGGEHGGSSPIQGEGEHSEETPHNDLCYRNRREEEKEDVIVIDEDVEQNPMAMISVALQLLDKIHLTLRTTEEGNFVSSEISLDQVAMQVSGKVETIAMNMQLTTGFNESDILNKVEKLFNLGQLKEEVLAINADHYDWVKQLAEYCFPGRTFHFENDYETDRYGQVRDALVSNTGNNGHKIVLTLNNPNERWLNIARNVDGIKGPVRKNGFAINIHLGQVIHDAKECWINEAGNPQDYSTWVEQEYSYLYNLETRASRYGKGSYAFEYLDSHCFKYSVVTEEETPFVSYGYSSIPGHKLLYIKGVCENCGAVTYNTVLKPLAHSCDIDFWANSHILTAAMDETAVSKLTALATSYDWMKCHVDETGKISYELLINFANNRFEEGNTIITNTHKSGNNSCTTIIESTIKVGGKVFRSSSYKKHSSYNMESIDSKIYHSDNPCVDYEVKFEKCNDCGKVYYDEWSTIDSHNYVVTWHGDSATQQVAYTERCTNCGEARLWYDYRCEHGLIDYDNEKQQYVCHDCGVEVGYFEGDNTRGVIVEELGVVEGNYRIGYLFLDLINDYAYKHDYSYQYGIGSQYDCIFTYSYFDEDTQEYVVVGDEDNLSLRMNLTMVAKTYSDMSLNGLTRFWNDPCYEVNNNDVLELKGQVEALHEGVQLIPTVILINTTGNALVVRL